MQNCAFGKVSSIFVSKIMVVSTLLLISSFRDTNLFHLHSLHKVHYKPLSLFEHSYLIHRDFYHLFLLDLLVITRLIADETYSFQVFAFICIFMDAVKSELLTLTFQSDCEDVSSYQTITLLLQSERLSKLRITPLAISVYLSQPYLQPQLVLQPFPKMNKK